MIIYVNNSHFLIVIPQTERSLIVLDPPQKPMIASWDSVWKIWDGEAIITAKTQRDLDLILSQ